MAKNAMEAHFDELTKLSELLNRYVNSYRLLVASAAELNNIYGRKEKEVKRAMERASVSGHQIDEVLEVIGAYQDNYLKYSKIKNDLIVSDYKGVKNGMKNIIQTEIDTELNFFNESKSRPEEDEEVNGDT